jgi:hypothetical protein
MDNGKTMLHEICNTPQLKYDLEEDFISSGNISYTIASITCEGDDGSAPMCDVDAIDKTGNTALHYAVKQGSIAFCWALLEAGADIQIVNDNNETALHCADENHHALVESLFIGWIANKSLRAMSNEYPYLHRKSDHLQIN